jgi:hypothetical protein
MKNFLLLICLSCIAAGAAAQSVRIGSLEFSVKKNQDTVAQFLPVDCPPCPDGSEPKKKPFKKIHDSNEFMGMGFVLPDNGSGYYTVLGGSSHSLDFGRLHRYHFAQRFALLGSYQYSYYNYKLRDAAADPAFADEVIGKTFANNEIKKQVFRSHNFALGTSLRFYFVKAKGRDYDKGGMYLDLGVQGDLAFSKYYKLVPHEDKNRKRRDGYAFNPFTASAVARIGWDNFAVFTRYRFTDAFNQKALPMDLPRVTIGIQFL